MLSSAGNTLVPLAAAVGCGLAAGVVSLFIRREPAAETPAPTRLAWFLAGTYFVVFGACALSRFYNLQYWGSDLGEYAGLVYNTARGRFFTQTFDGFYGYFVHFAPLLFALCPLSYVFREPFYLVFIVAFSAAASVALIYFLGAARGARWPAFALASSYALSPLLHGATLYGNPLRAMAAPLVLAGILFFVRRRFRWGVLFTFLAATASEEMAVYAIVVAAVGVWVCRKGRSGILIVAAFAFYAFGIAFQIYPKLLCGQPRLPHYWTYVQRLQEGGILTLFEPKGILALSTRLWFFATTLGPVAAFLPFAGVGALLIAAPGYLFLTHDHTSIVRHGFGFPFQFLPFAYAAAAFGLARISALRRVRLRKFLLAGGSIAAVTFQIVSIGTSYRPWYVGIARSLFPDYHKLGTLAGIRKVPGEIAISADQPAFTYLAHNRDVATVYPRGLGLGGLEKVDAVFLDRDFHCALVMPSDMARLRAAGFYPAEVTRDYAYFTRAPGGYSYDDVWKAWYGVISESHFCTPGINGRPRRDSRAPGDGVVRRFDGSAFLWRKDRYIFPPGRYKFTYILACERDAFYHVSTRLIIRRPYGRGAGRRISRCWTLNRDGEYHGYVFKFKINKPSVISIDLTGTPGYFFDGVVVEGQGYNLNAVGKYCPWPYVPSLGLVDEFK
jgi:uncharacterized membrane protein